MDRNLPRFGLIVCAGAALLAPLGPQRSVANESEAEQSMVRVAIFSDKGVTKKLHNFERCLPAGEGFAIDFVSGDDVRRGALDRFKVVIHPGGSASKQAEMLGKKGREQVRDFVAAGGGYVGICAGAYLASAQYSWSLGVIDAKVIDTEHWARGSGDVDLRLADCGKVMFASDDDLVSVLYNQGPLLGPGENGAIPDYETVALFETEIAKNGAPSGVMKGTTAVARGNFGQGRAIAISPHPEQTTGRDDFIRAAVRWAAGNTE